MRYLYLFFILFSVSSFAQNTNLTRYVNPLIGTEGMGHTFPGATVPFGMVQLSPDTDTLTYDLNGKYNKDIYRYCAGYQYEDPTIVGFSHTHFNGTGHSDLGDFLIMPTTGALHLNPGTAAHPDKGYRSAFTHESEVAAPNYYKVDLADYEIKAELTTSERTGFHRYTFRHGEAAHIILDMRHGIYNYPGKNRWTSVRVVNDTTVVGYRQTSGWARNRTLYFALVFDRPIKNYGMKDFSSPAVYRGFWGKFNQENNFPLMEGKEISAHFDFDIADGEQVQLKMALSSVSTEGALLNLKTEIPHWNFDRVRAEGTEKWNQELQKIQIQSADQEVLTNFYTAMYHSFINPTLYMDVDGQYKGLDGNIHRARDFVNYTTFSLWDTFRAQHPLLNLIQPKRNNDMIQSMLAHFDQNPLKMLPVWSNSANENWTMTGYHAVSVLADAVVTDTYNFDAARALKAAVVTANSDWFEGVGAYKEFGYVPEDKSNVSVSKTLEYAFDDWTIAQMADRLGEEEIYTAFINRSTHYKQVFDPLVGFMRPKDSAGLFLEDFDPLKTDQTGFIEGNSWNYSLYVPQDPEGLMKLIGGEQEFTRYLDTLFTMHLDDKYFAAVEDVDRGGIIGNYVHGNEPSHQIPYFYNWTKQAYKTQYWVRYILNDQYHTGPGGLKGNDDTGQMSAWYIFGALGFYPVAPASGQFALGSPLVSSAALHLENGNTFKIKVHNQAKDHVYVQRATLNGKQLLRPFINFSDIIKGGILEFEMGPNPKK